jgi:alpha-tubulin suppressor-like RCC1 family protein
MRRVANDQEAMQMTSTAVIAITSVEYEDGESEAKIAVEFEREELTNARSVSATEFGWSWCEVMSWNAVRVHVRSLIDADEQRATCVLQLPTTLEAIHSMHHLRSHVVLVYNASSIAVFSSTAATANETITQVPPPLLAIHELDAAIGDVSCSNSLFLCCTVDGKVFAVSDQQADLLQRVPFPNGSRMRNVRCADRHCVALSDRGEVFTWGDCSYGRLGLAEDDTSSNPPQPQELQALGGTGEMQPDGTFNGIKLLDCGLWHSVAVSHVDDVFVWGWNNDGQLESRRRHHPDGGGDDDGAPPIGKVVATPQRLSAMDALIGDGERIVQVTCGATFTALQTSCSKLFVFGRLGLPSARTDRSILRGIDVWAQLTDCFPGKRLSDLQVTAGRWHLCVTDQQPQLL